MLHKWLLQLANEKLATAFALSGRGREMRVDFPKTGQAAEAAVGRPQWGGG